MLALGLPASVRFLIRREFVTEQIPSLRLDRQEDVPWMTA